MRWARSDAESGALGTSRTASAAPSGGGQFAAALRTWRRTRGLSQAALAKQIMYSRSLVNLVENGHRRATEALAQAADAALDAAGKLHTVWTSTYVASPPPVRESPDRPPTDRTVCVPRAAAVRLAGAAVTWLAGRDCTDVLIIAVCSIHPTSGSAATSTRDAVHSGHLLTAGSGDSEDRKPGGHGPARSGDLVSLASVSGSTSHRGDCGDDRQPRWHSRPAASAYWCRKAGTTPDCRRISPPAAARCAASESRVGVPRRRPREPARRSPVTGTRISAAACTRPTHGVRRPELTK